MDLQQGKTIAEVLEALAHHDLAALQDLSPQQQRAAQLAARSAVYQQAHSIWEHANADGLDPATRPDWQPVALMCGLTHALHATAATAATETSTAPPGPAPTPATGFKISSGGVG